MRIIKIGFALLIAGGLALIFVASLVLSNLSGSGLSQDAAVCTGGALVQPVGFATTADEWTPEQRDNANAIVGIGIARGFSYRDTKIALMTAMQESNLRVIPYGDRDSLSLFQQRPSIKGGDGRPYWGTAEQIMNRTYTVNRFYDEMARKVPDRDSMRETEVAQKIQASAFPEAYQKWADEADAILTASNFGDTGPNDSGVLLAASEACSQAVTVGTAGSWMIPIDKSAYRISSNYGMRWDSLHDGLDMAAPAMTPIYATNDGTIIELQVPPGGGWGNTVVIDHGDGSRTRYAHMHNATQLIGLQVGQQVKKGDLIGYVGTTGKSTGNHLHLTVYLNCPGSVSLNSVCDTVDPVQFYGSKGLQF